MDFPPDESFVRLRSEIANHQLPTERPTPVVYYLGVQATPSSRPVFLGGSARSPIGASHGALSGWHPVDLLAHVLDDVRQHLTPATERPGERSGEGAAAVDHIVVANATAVGALASPLRSLALAGHWAGALDGIEVGGGRLAGHQALAHGAQLVSSGGANTVLVCSIDMASVVPPGAPLLRRDYGKPLTPATVRELTATGGHLPDGPFADTLGLTREQIDSWVAASFAAAAECQAHLTPTTSLIRDPERSTPYQGPDLITDELLRRSLDDIEDLDPMFAAGGVVTALSLAQPGDGAVAVLLSSTPGAYRLGSTVVESGHSFAPIEPLLSVAQSVQNQDSLVYVASEFVARKFVASEPSAAHTLALAKGLGLDPGVINPHGGAVARGRLDGGEVLQGLHDTVTAGSSGFALLSASGDGAALATRVERSGSEP